MSKDTHKSSHAKPAPVPAPVIVDLRGRVPQMTDEALAQLNANVLRLKDSGSPLQRTSAADLLPVVEAELAARHAYKLANPPPKKARATKKKAVAVAAAEAAKPASQDDAERREEPEPNDEPALLDEPDAEAEEAQDE